jgi:hypothetical protein
MASLRRNFFVKSIAPVIAFALALLSSFVASSNKAEAWQQIQHPYFTVIFNQGLEDEASRVADLLNFYLDQHLQELPIEESFKPIPIVLFTSSHVSNGNVGFAPYRSHWYNKPSAFAGLEWFDILAVHEGRHIVQFNQLYDHQTGKILHLMFGQQGLQILAGLFIPTWFIEGDAVVSETELTLGGRGRSAAFSLWLRADWLSNKAYDYERAMLGTGFDRLPYLSPYDMGYFFTSYFKSHYDDQLMDRVLDKTGTWQAMNFNDAVVNETGQNLKSHYQQMTEGFRQKWQIQLDQLTLSDVEILNANHSDHWRSVYPVGISNGQLVAVEVDVEQGHRLVKIQDKKVQEVTEIASDVSASYWTASKNKSVFLAEDDICWVTFKPDLRRPNQPYSLLECWRDSELDVVSDNQFLTSASYGHGRFIAHEFDAQRRSFLLLLDAKGNELKRLELPKRSIVYDFTATEQGWLVVMQDSDTRSIVEVDQELTERWVHGVYGSENVRSPLKLENWLLYISDLTGIDQVMAKNLTTAEEFQVLTRPFGSYFLTKGLSQGDVILSDYSAKGQQLVSFHFDPERSELWIPREQLSQGYQTFSQKDAIQPVDFGQRYEASAYNPAKHLWNPHSWNVFYDGTLLSGTLYSTNAMQNFDVQLGLGIVPEQRDWTGFVAAQSTLQDGTQVVAQAEKAVLLLGGSVWINQLNVAWPLQAETGVYTQQWLPSVGIQWLNSKLTRPAMLATAQLNFSHVKQSAFHDIQSPLGVQSQLSANYNLVSDSVAVYSELGFVRQGFTHRQSLAISGAAQWLEGDAIPIMSESALFPGEKDAELSFQGRASYEWNLGAVGRSFTPLLYWRNTSLELSSIMEFQSDESLTETAVGASLKPSLNVLRNANVRVAPTLSAYYQPNSDQWSVYFELLIGGH